MPLRLVGTTGYGLIRTIFGPTRPDNGLIHRYSNQHLYIHVIGIAVDLQRGTANNICILSSQVTSRQYTLKPPLNLRSFLQSSILATLAYLYINTFYNNILNHYIIYTNYTPPTI